MGDSRNLFARERADWRAIEWKTSVGSSAWSFGGLIVDDEEPFPGFGLMVDLARLRMSGPSSEWRASIRYAMSWLNLSVIALGDAVLGMELINRTL